MLIRESTLRKLIQEALLLEAVYKQKDLMALSPELTDIISKQFEMIDVNASLSNEKSPGRFFIDVLYECMRELLGEFDPVADARKGSFLEKVENICIQLIILFQQKEVSSSTVQTGETFKDYIYKFMLKPKEFLVKDDEDRPIIDMITKLRYVYNSVISRSTISGLERIMQFKQQIKRKETYYPFGQDLVDGKYLVVCPLNVMSSIFWARTNWLGEEIVIPNHNDIDWCTARFEGGNMFNSYFNGGGTNLFYFLPVNDITGREKFCVGFTKMKENEDEENSKTYLVIGGHTTVDFNNKPVIEEQERLNKKLLLTVSKKLNVSIPVLDVLVAAMKNKEPADKYKYISLLDVGQFAAATNINTLAPFDVQQQISEVLNTYKNPKYLARGFKPDPKILKYVDKKWDEWKAAGVDINLIHLPESRKISDPNIIMQMIDSNDKKTSRYAMAYAANNIASDPNLIMYAIFHYKDDSFLRDFSFIPTEFLSDFNFINTLLDEIEKHYSSPIDRRGFIILYSRLSPELQQNKEIIRKFILIVGEDLFFRIPKEEQLKNRDLGLLAVKAEKGNWQQYIRLPKIFQEDIEFATVALESCTSTDNFHNLIHRIPAQFRKDKNFILNILQKFLNTNTGPVTNVEERCVQADSLDKEVLSDYNVLITIFKYNDRTIKPYRSESAFNVQLTRLIKRKGDLLLYDITENYELLKRLSLEVPDVFKRLCFAAGTNTFEMLLRFEQLLNLCAYIYFCSNSSYDVLSNLADPDIFNSIKVELDKLLEMDPNTGKYVNEEYFQKAFAYSNSLNNITYSNGRISSGLRTEGRHTRKLIMTESQLKRLLFRYL